MGSGFGKNVSNWLGRDTAYPTNVLHLATECANRTHSAVFPAALPEWFIRLFTRPGDVVLDPFMGSGTALLAAQQRLERRYVGIDVRADYCALAREALAEDAAAREAAEPPPPASLVRAAGD